MNKCIGMAYWRGKYPGSRVMFIGEAPGKIETMMGQPFVGPSGKMLQGWIDNILNLKDGDYLITNSVCFWPRSVTGKTRTPTPEESMVCLNNHLQAFVNQAKPKVIVAVGRVAERSVKCLDPLTLVGTRTIFIKHPAYFLRGHSFTQDVFALKQQIDKTLGL